MFKTAEPKRKRNGKPSGMGAYVRITPRLFYISADAGKLWGDYDTCSVSIYPAYKVMVISPHGPWKLSTVCEARNAKRIETPNCCISFLDAGFPKGLLGKYLPCSVDMAGSLIVSLMVDYDLYRKVEG